MRCDAKMVLISVDFPRPVWPAAPINFVQPYHKPIEHTNANDIELKPPFQELSFYLRCDAVETNVAPREYRVLLRRHGICSNHP